MTSLEECIENGNCRVTLFKQDGCPHCSELKNKLEDLGIDYEEREVTQEVLDRLGRETVPFVQIDNNITGKETIIENENIDNIRNKIRSNQDDDDTTLLF